MPFTELVDLVTELSTTPDTALARAELGPAADWTATDENLAMLVDADRNHLQYLWSQWTASEADRRRRQHRRPPATPPLTPYAVRPPAVAAALEQLDTTPVHGAAPDRNGLKPMPLEDLARLI